VIDLIENKKKRDGGERKSGWKDKRGEEEKMKRR